jgi:membrane-bound lytic murein transglycosylase D
MDFQSPKKLFNPEIMKLAVMKIKLLFCLIICGISITNYSFSQALKVPQTMYFAGMKLNISDEATELIKKDYLVLVKNSKYFTSIVQRADLYFPIIEKVFEEEEAPADFKFLALQESSLQSDAVSKSNAVGYWQFKKETATENGLQVDYLVDERKNIVASSRAACKYLKKNNAVLKNWVYTLLSYYLGRGGAMPYVKEQYQGSNEMDIDKDMNWYVIRFLAHKFAYERVVGQVAHPQLRLSVYTQGSGKSLSDIAKEKNIDLPLLSEYNKWLNTPEVPSQKQYAVILPYTISTDFSGDNVVLSDKTSTKPNPVKTSSNTTASSSNTISSTPLIVEHNQIRAIKARKGDSFASLANAGSISLRSFLQHNELQSFDQVTEGALYYLQAKKNKALVLTHTVQPNETLWFISQLYGIRMAAIRKKNRMRPHENIKPGQVLWLKKKLPKDVEIERKKEKVAKNAPYFVQDKTETPEHDNAYKPSPFVTGNHTKTSEAEPINSPKPITNNNSENTTSKILTNTDSTIASKPLNNEPTKPIANTEKTNILTNANVINKPILNDSIYWHTVKQTETLYRISKLYNTSVDSIKYWNNFMANEISVNQVLKIKIARPQTSQSEPNTITHEVKQGETLYKISRDYGVRLEQILEWNNKKTNTVSLGEKLLIKKNP